MKYSDAVISALIKAGAAELLPAEGSIAVGRVNLVVPAWYATRGARVAYAAFPTGDLTLAAFAGSMGGRTACLPARLATAFRTAHAGTVNPAIIAAVTEAKAMVADEVQSTRLAPIQITIG